MTITELIKKLEELKSKYGDVKLYTNTQTYSVIATEKLTLECSDNKQFESIVWKNDNN